MRVAIELTRKPLALALAMLSLDGAAQEAPMQTVEVTGIRASLAKSLEVKRSQVANVEVVTAEDVGKMPDKNLADSLDRKSTRLNSSHS